MYKQIFRPILSFFKPETSRRLFFALVWLAARFPGRHIIRLFHGYTDPSLQRELFGLHFPHPVGLAAGFDNNGTYINELSDYGFAFMEIGSLSGDAQDGGQKPRLLRYARQQAMVTRLEGCNKGVSYAISRIQEKRPDTILCASITFNASSHKDDEVSGDFQKAFSLLYDFVDMFTINVSRPNADGLLAVQDRSSLADILDPLLELRLCYEHYKPILVKVSPDTPFEQLDEMTDYCMLSGVDGVVAGGTSRRLDLLGDAAPASGRLSGAPIFEQSLSVVKHIYEHTKGRFPIIGCGGITTPERAAQMLDAGASLVEMHTGIAFEGPKLVKKTLKYLVNRQS